MTRSAALQETRRQTVLLLVLAFGRVRDAVIVAANLPLALIGGVAGVFLAGGVLNVATMIGFITLTLSLGSEPTTPTAAASVVLQ